MSTALEPPLSFFLQIAQVAREKYRHPVTWTHVIVASIDQARKYSTYGKEPLLRDVRKKLQQRVLSNLTMRSGGFGLKEAELIVGAKSLEEYEENLPPLSRLQDRVLRWFADYPVDVDDWTLSVWYELLRELKLTPGHFDGTCDWTLSNTSKELSSEDNNLSWESELNMLVGLSHVKDEIRRLRDFLQIRSLRQQRGIPTGSFSLHQVFTGNPGTGKTSVARILAKIYKSFGFLSKGHMVETDRSGLVGQYIGGTEAKTEEMIRKALGGVLFIDEAYSLAGGGKEDFGPRAIDTLVKMMEDHRDDLVVIVAGYEKEMQTFLESNSGLSSRFTRFISYPDYTGEELVEILRRIAARESFEVPEEVTQIAHDHLMKKREELGNRFGNAREVRNLWEKMLMRQAQRLISLYPSGEIPEGLLQQLHVDDLCRN